MKNITFYNWFWLALTGNVTRNIHLVLSTSTGTRITRTPLREKYKLPIKSMIDFVEIETKIAIVNNCTVDIVAREEIVRPYRPMQLLLLI